MHLTYNAINLQYAVKQNPPHLGRAGRGNLERFRGVIRRG